MKRLLSLTVLAAALMALSACAGAPNRLAGIATGLAAPGGGDPADRAYRRELAALIADATATRIDLANGLGPDNPVVDHIDSRLRETRLRVGALAEPLGSPIEPVAARPDNGRRQFERPWRTSRQILFLAPAGKDTGDGPFFFSGLGADRVEIRLAPTGLRAFRLRLVCDGQMTVRERGARKVVAAGMPVVVAAAEGSAIKALPVLEPDAGVQGCRAELEFADGRRTLTILREETALPSIAAIDRRYDVCPAPSPSADPLTRAFLAPRWLSQTCPMAIGRPALLTGEREGFDAKVAALLGTSLPESFYRKGDPELPLDFSRAPILTLIQLSYLDIKADFSGRIIERLVRYHAARGTRVRIVSSDVLEREKDRAMLEALAADHPNVEVKFFAWVPPKGTTLDDWLARFHRVQHTKMLMALSSQPGRSVAVLGGRNIHDGFLFDQPVDLRRYPELQQYGRLRGATLNYYSNWRDIDIAIHADAAVATLAAHLSTLWHADTETYVARPFSVSSRAGPAHGGASARHFISVPYADGRALETYYVDLVDAARQKIEIISPYLNLTPDVGAALERALDRGVSITIVGRIDMSGDLGGSIVTALNRLFVERYADRIAIYDYRDTKILLHAKVVMIDGRLVTLSSVNLNHRSFIHDNENGLTVLDPAYYRRMHAIFDQYISASERVSRERIPLAWRLLFKSRIIREAL